MLPYNIIPVGTNFKDSMHLFSVMAILHSAIAIFMFRTCSVAYCFPFLFRKDRDMY